MRNPLHTIDWPRWPLPVRAFVLASLAIPFVHGELFPWTDAALFTEAGDRFAAYEVVDPETGASWAPAADALAFRFVGLRGDSRLYPDPAPGALRRDPTANRWGEILDEAAVVAAVEATLDRPDAPTAVVVTQRAFGDVGGGHVGLIATRTWRVERRVKRP